RGSVRGSVDSISVPGPAFQSVGLPLLPFAIAPGSDVRFGIRYSPTQVGNDTGTVAIGLGGTSFRANLAGTGISSKFSYQLLTSPNPTPITPNQVITLPDTNVGE